jgi:hypothetical protein
VEGDGTGQDDDQDDQLEVWKNRHHRSLKQSSRSLACVAVPRTRRL